MERARARLPFLLGALAALAVLLPFLCAGPAVSIARKQPARPAPKKAFVTVQGGRFMLAGRSYRFVGANFWQGMNMGASGDRPRLVAELKHLRRLGITNLRVMAASEGPNGEPYRMTPVLETSPGAYNQQVLDGLDFLLAQMRKNGMRAVLVLNNFWYWSGGMAQYVSWHEHSRIPYPNKTGDWNTFVAYSARFYSCDECQRWYRNHIRLLVGHVNPYTHLKYRNDPTIFSWELANEPRSYPDEWIDSTAAYVKSLDPNHLVTTGSEGAPPGEGDDFVKTHDGPDIDYATIHIWPQNAGFYDPENPAASIESALQIARDFFRQRAAQTKALGKPLVLEEFGLARDWEPLHDLYNPASGTKYRDRVYRAMYREVELSAARGGAAAGDNFWAWAGRARPGSRWIGDPPHETAGWYSVYDKDQSTLTIISAHARKLAALR